MDTPPAFGFQQLFNHVIGDMAKAISERNGETPSQQFARSQAAVHAIMGFLPRDVIEAMLAGHCVMFHELMTDSIRDTLRGEVDTMRRATRSSIVAMDKAFANNLARLERYQLRPSPGHRDAAEAPMDTSAELPPETADPVVRPTMQTPPDISPDPASIAPQAQPIRTPPEPLPAPETTLVFTPTAEAIAACRANPEAMAALEAGDPERFARAMGLDMPSEDHLDAAAAPGSPFARSQPPGYTRAFRPGGADAVDGSVRVVLELTDKATAR